MYYIYYTKYLNTSLVVVDCAAYSSDPPDVVPDSVLLLPLWLPLSGVWTERTSVKVCEGRNHRS